MYARSLCVCDVDLNRNVVYRLTNGFITFSILTESIFPPVFGRRLQAQVAKRGGHVLLEVEVSGIPEPTVTWYKDGVELDVEVTPDRAGSNHTLVFDPGIAIDVA